MQVAVSNIKLLIVISLMWLHLLHLHFKSSFRARQKTSTISFLTLIANMADYRV